MDDTELYREQILRHAGPVITGTFVGFRASYTRPVKIGQPVVLDNRPGGAGVLASEIVARATPDGHTLLLASFGIVTNPNGAIVMNNHSPRLESGTGPLASRPATPSTWSPMCCRVARSIPARSSPGVPSGIVRSTT